MQYTPTISEEERAARHAQRAAARKKKQRDRRRKQLRQFLPITAFLLLLIFLFILWHLQSTQSPPDEKSSSPALPIVSMPEVEPEALPNDPYKATANEATLTLGDSIDSCYAVLIDVSSGAILAQKDADIAINPASMTKVLTLLVAAENLTESDLDKSFTMTIDIADYCFVNDCSVMGLEVGETVPVRELLYGCILPSGADASLGLAFSVSGSHEAFVELMNAKLEELGLSDTAHFTNCVGLYDKNHFCTISDMALILKAAMDNELCREVLNSRTYQTESTPFHAEGQTLSNWFLRRIEDRFTEDFQIVAGKTGYVTQSGSCAVSCGQDQSGRLFICATGKAGSSWRAIYDHTNLYQTYCS